jgi:hypothetical protein
VRRAGLAFGSRRSTGDFEGFATPGAIVVHVKTDRYRGPLSCKQTSRSRLMSPSSSSNGQGARWQSGSWRFEKAEGVSDNGLFFTDTSTEGGLLQHANRRVLRGEVRRPGLPVQRKPWRDQRGHQANRRPDDRGDWKARRLAVYVTEMTVSSDGQSMNIVTDDKRRGTTDKYVATKQ